MNGDFKPWEFFGFESWAEGRPVQDWFDKLSLEARDEIVDLVSYLAVRPSGQWATPEFDPLDGEGGVSELRPQDIRCDEGSLTYRIYGVGGYPAKRSYTFLHGTRKEVKNDQEGKEIARRRLKELLRDKGKPHPQAGIHKFDFEGKRRGALESRPGSEGKVC